MSLSGGMSDKTDCMRMWFVISKGLRDQAKECAWRMPWHQEPKKDVASCEKLRGTANRFRSVDVRMGQPRTLKGV